MCISSTRNVPGKYCKVQGKQGKVPDSISKVLGSYSYRDQLTGLAYIKKYKRDARKVPGYSCEGTGKLKGKQRETTKNTGAVLRKLWEIQDKFQDSTGKLLRKQEITERVLSKY